MRGRHGPANWNFIAKLESKDPRICVSGARLNKLPVATIVGVSSSSQSIGCALWFSAVEAKKSRERSSAKKSREQGAREAHRSHSTESTRKSKGASRRACRRRRSRRIHCACRQAKHTSSRACRMPMTPGREGQTGRVWLVWPSAGCTLAIALLLCAPATRMQCQRVSAACHDRVQMNSKMRSPA